MRIHGLRRPISPGPPLDEVLDELLTRLTGRVLVAHVAVVEVAFLRRALETRGLDLRNPVIDTAALAEVAASGENQRSRTRQRRGPLRSRRRASPGSRAGWGFPSIGPTTPMETRSRPHRSSSRWQRIWRSSAR